MDEEEKKRVDAIKSSGKLVRDGSVHYGDDLFTAFLKLNVEDPSITKNSGSGTELREFH